MCKNLDHDDDDRSTKHVHVHDNQAHEHFHGDRATTIVSTIGLVIHSIADGVALGASLYCKSNRNTSISFIINNEMWSTN